MHSWRPLASPTGGKADLHHGAMITLVALVAGKDRVHHQSRSLPRARSEAQEVYPYFADTMADDEGIAVWTGEAGDLAVRSGGGAPGAHADPGARLISASRHAGVHRLFASL